MTLPSKYGAGVPFLRAKLRMATALIEAIRLERDPLSASRNMAAARSALEGVERVLGRIPMSCEEAVELRQAATALRNSLRRCDEMHLDAA
jgi:hypothetical protein